MSRYGFIGVSGLLFLATAAWGCGDDDDGPADGGSGGSSAPSGKALEDLTASEMEALCDDLLAVVREASTPERQCIELGLGDAMTEAACNRARMECLDDETYEDFDAVRCAKYTGSCAATAPDFACDTEVSEVRSCYASVSSWLKGLRCSQAGDAPEIPSCVEELEDDCDFGLSALVALPEVDAGLSCEPSGGSSCSCGGETFDYDFGVGAQCNSCAIESCCDSFAECQNDSACRCYWECLGEGDDDCYGRCNITMFPPAFSEHASCLTSSCGDPCELTTP
jgi:hypothetical protein